MSQTPSDSEHTSPTGDSELAFASATDIAQKISRKEISCVEILQLYLDRVDRFNPELNAIIVDIREQAEKAAQDMDKVVAKGDAIGARCTVYR